MNYLLLTQFYTQKMVLKKLTLLASLACIGYMGISCSAKEDQDSYDKFYGSGRADREKAAAEAMASAPSATERKIDPDTINSLSVTEDMDTEIGASDERSDNSPETAGETVEEETKGEQTAQAPAPKAQGPPPADIAALLNKHTCSACHRPYERLVGPAYSDVAKKNYSVDRIVELVYKPEPSNWPGYPPMIPMPQVPKEDVQKLAKWINSLN